MIVFLNGEFVPEEQAAVSVFDRSFQYGDGLFETLRISNGRPFRWTQHLERLAQGAAFAGIQLPFDSAQLAGAATELIRLNHSREAVLRLALSRGVGHRGYSPRGADRPTMVMSCHPAEPLPPTPPQWTLFTSSFRLDTADPLGRWKTSNKLLQVLARREAEDHGADEALLLNKNADICEAASGNVFWLEEDQLCTPPADAGLLAGITRAAVMELAPTLGLSVTERTAPANALGHADGAFVTMSSVGIVEVVSLDGKALRKSTQTGLLHEAYCRLLKANTA